MDTMLPTPPLAISFGNVTVRFEGFIVGDDESGVSLGYHFRVKDPRGRDAGHVNFRVCDTPRNCFCIGHIGYAIHPEHRGQGYALQACRAIAAFVHQVKGSVIITADPDNMASIRTIERLGAQFLDERPVSEDDPEYLRGSRIKRRFEWRPYAQKRMEESHENC